MAVGLRDILPPTIAVTVSLKKRRRSEDELSDLTGEQPLPKLHKSNDLKVDIEMSTSGLLCDRYFAWPETILFWFLLEERTHITIYSLNNIENSRLMHKENFNNRFSLISRNSLASFKPIASDSSKTAYITRGLLV